MLTLKNERLHAKLEKKMEAEGVVLSSEESDDFRQIMLEHDDDVSSSFEPGSFQSIFWKRSITLSSSKGRAGIH